MGMGMGVMFMFISLSKPLKTLSPIRPPKRLFHWSFILTIISQIIIHFSTLFYFISLAEPHIVKDESFKPDADFKPNLKNTVVYIFNMTCMTTNFFVNYEGPPLTESITENAKLKKVLMALYGIIIASALDVEIVWEYLELVPFPTEDFCYKILLALALNVGLCYYSSKFIK